MEKTRLFPRRPRALFGCTAPFAAAHAE